MRFRNGIFAAGLFLVAAGCGTDEPDSILGGFDTDDGVADREIASVTVMTIAEFRESDRAPGDPNELPGVHPDQLGCSRVWIYECGQCECAQNGNIVCWDYAPCDP